MLGRSAKSARRVLIAFGAFLLLAVSALLLGGFLANSEIVQARVRTFLEQACDQRLVIVRFHVALLPRPRVQLQQVLYQAPSHLQSRAAEVVFYPRLAALLRGQLQIHTVTIDAPEVVLHLPEQRSAALAADAVSHQVQNQYTTLLAGWSRFFAGGQLTFRKAAVTVLQGDKQLARLDLIEGDVTGAAGRLEGYAHGRSDLASGFELQARLAAVGPAVTGRLSVKGLHVGAVADLVTGDNVGLAADLDLALDFVSQDLTTWNLALQGNQPALTLAVGERRVTLLEPAYAVQMQLTPDRLEAHLNQLHLEVPRVDLSGTLTNSRHDDEKSPRLQLALQGSVVDLTALRDAALGLMAYTPTVMQIVQGGTLSQIRLSASSPTWAGLFAPDGFRIEALAADGRLTIPHVDVALTEVAGRIAYAKGTLTGEQASARYGASVGRNGELYLQTDAEPVAMALVLDLEADLSQLPPILKKTVTNPDFAAEMELVGNVSGQAAGRLILDGPVDHLAVEVLVNSVAARIEYARLPYPLELSGGRITWAEKTFVVEELAGNLKNSRFNGLSGKAVWQEEAAIDVHQAVLDLACEELSDWLKPYLAALWPGAGLEIPGGRVVVTQLKLRGPAALPRQWSFAATGTVADLVVATGRRPVPVAHITGRFDVTPGRLAVEAARVSMLDADLNGSATVGLDADGQLDLFFGPVGGTLGRQAMQWVHQRTNLPQRYQIDAPLQFDVSEARWNRRQGWTLAVRLIWLDQQLQVAGQVVPSADSVHIDLAINAPRIDATALEQVFAPAGDDFRGRAEVSKRPSGRIALHVDRLEYNHHVFEPLTATFVLSGGGALVEIARADLCGISIAGKADWSPQGIDLELQPRAKDQRLQYIGGCLAGVRSTERFEGELSIEGALHARGRTMRELADKAQGTLQYSVVNGRVTNVGAVGVFTNLLSFLKINRLLSGTAPNFFEKDFPFQRLAGRLDFAGTTVTVRDAVLHADALNMVAEGTVDTQSGEVNLTVLVSPLNTIDTLVRKLPVVGHILQGTLVAVPVGVSGQLANPTIVPLSPLAVGTRIWEILTRTLKTPLRLIQPLLPSGSEKNGEAPLPAFPAPDAPSAGAGF